MLRTADRVAFIENMSNLDIRPGPTFTFAFWGIAQYMDVPKWVIRGVVPGMTIPFNKFCGAPPVRIVIYSLDESGMTENDQRHLESRKRYYFNLAFWSSQKPPLQETIERMF